MESPIAKLVPFTRDSARELSRIAFHADIWTYMETCISDQADLDRYISTALGERERNESYPFIVIDKRKHRVAGSSRFGLVDPDNDAIEIGWTWYGKEFCGTGLNQACKHLLLQYIFEGVLREVFKRDRDTYHDLAVYSILKSDWPSIRDGIYRS